MCRCSHARPVEFACLTALPCCASVVVVQLSCPQLVGLSLLVYARRGLLPHITGQRHTCLVQCCAIDKQLMINVVLCADVRSCNVGVGLMGMAGNKGAVAVRFNLFNSPVRLFLSFRMCHCRPRLANVCLLLQTFVCLLNDARLLSLLFVT